MNVHHARVRPGGRVLASMLVLLLTASLLVSTPAVARAQDPADDPIRILLFYKTQFHASYAQANQAIRELADQIADDVDREVEVVATDQASAFTPENLAGFDTLVFSQTGGILFDDAQRAALEGYINDGGGWMGIHYAAWSANTTSEHDVNPWYLGLVGAVSESHPENPALRDGLVRVADPDHPLVQGLPETFTRNDEWYDFNVNPSQNVRTLLSVDESSYTGGRMGTDHPITWCHDYDGGRSWYTAMGHDGVHFSEPHMRTMLRRGLEYTAGIVEADCSPPDHSDVGSWSETTPWSVMAINAALTHDGLVQSFGTVSQGCTDPDPFDWFGTCLSNGAPFETDVWDPADERTRDNYRDTIVVNGTYTDLFCSIQVHDPNRRVMLTVGGDDNLGDWNDPVNASLGVTSYSSRTGLNDEAPMNEPRWYPTATTMADGSIVVQGGSTRGVSGPGATIPERYSPDEGNGWTLLRGAESAPAYQDGGENRWWYPRAWVAPNGDLYNLTGTVSYDLDPTGDGELTMHGQLPAAIRDQGALGWPVGATSTAVMYEPGKILQVGGGDWSNGASGRDGARAGFTVDLTGPGGTADPEFAVTEPMRFGRHWANSTLLPNGEVLVTGGGRTNNGANGYVTTPEIWNPQTGEWTSDLAPHAHARLYHSTALLLPDGRVMIAGGGSPGPRNYMDAEFYSPPYLFDGRELAERPEITQAPDVIGYDGAFDIEVSGDVDRVTLVRNGSVTHSFNNGQLFQELDFVRAPGSDTITVEAPTDGTQAPPGAFMLFVVDSEGVPSVAAMLEIDPEQPMDARMPVVVDMFEYPKVPAEWRSANPPSTIAVDAGDGRMAPWTIDGAVQLVRGMVDGMGGLGVVGYHLALGENGRMERTIDGLQAGRDYRLSFRYARDSRRTVPADGVVALDLEVADLDVTVEAGPDVPSRAASPATVTTFDTFVGTFTASGRSEVLSLAAAGTHDGMVIDDLVVVGVDPGTDEVPVHYEFEEGEGATAANTGLDDRVGAGTLTGATGWSEDGLFGSALDLPGGDRVNAVDLPDDLLRDEDDFSVSFWVRPDSFTNWSGLFHVGNGEDSFFQIQTRTDAQPGGSGLAATFKAAGSDLQERIFQGASTDLVGGRWNHVAFTREGSTGTLYLDGAPIASRDDLTIDLADIGATSDNWLGRNGFPDDAFDGLMDDVRIYTSTLTDAEVASLYDDGSALATTVEIEVDPVSPSPFGEPLTVTATVEDAAGDPAEGTAELWLETVRPGDPNPVRTRHGQPVAVGEDGTADFGELELARGDHVLEVRFRGAPGWRDAQAEVTHVISRPPPGEGVPIHWTFDEGQGTTSANVGTDTVVGDARLNNGNVTWREGVHGSAVDLPGGGSTSGNFVALPNDLTADLEDEFTVAMWANPRALPQWVPLFQIGSSTDTFFLLQSNLGPGTPGGFGATFKQAGNATQERLALGSGNDLPFNTWTHVTFTMAGSTGRIYFDGELVAERHDFSLGIGDVGVGGTTTANFLGNTSWPDPMWNGGIDDVRIYAHELSAEEVADLHASEPEDVETEVSATADEIVSGDAGSVAVTVTPSAATGEVEVADGDTVLGTATLSSGTATVTLPAGSLAVGEHELDVRYLGADGFAPSATSVTVVVVEPTPEDVPTTVSATAADVAPGQDATVQVTVSPSQATGTVEVADDDSVLGTATLSDGAATVTIDADDLVAGPQVLTVRYLGAEGFLASSTPVVVRVLAPPVDERTNLSAAAADVDEGDDATVLVTVTPSTATGTVEVVDGGRVIGSAELDGGDAAITIAADDLTVGSKVLTVRYLGADGFAPSSTLVVVRVLRGATPPPPVDPEEPDSLVCDPLGGYDRGRFDDTRGSSHERNVLCMAELGLTEGLRGGDRYGPRLDVDRGQMASYIARFVEVATGEELEARGGFRDVPADHPHAENILKLAAIGVTEGTGGSGGRDYAPQAPVSRGQMASFIARALTYVETGRSQPETVPPRTSTDHFRDDDGSVHEANIDALAEVGIVAGYGDGRYGWRDAVKRDQMASFVVRAFDHAVRTGAVTRG